MKKNYFLLLGLSVLLLISCEKDNEMTNDSDLREVQAETPVFMDLDKNIFNLTFAENSGLQKSMTGDEYQVAVFSAEYTTTGEDGRVGNTIFFNNRGNKQLSIDFVPGLALDGTNNISYYTDANRPSENLNVGVTNAAVDRAMATWNNVSCSETGIFEVPYDGRATGIMAESLGYGKELEEGEPGAAYVADVLHGGWLPGEFFDVLAEDGSEFILGVTFTFIFTSAGGIPTDLDNNGKADAAFREIYYNDNFGWNDGATYDVETIALHEAGHGLSQDHFGKAFLSNGNDRLHFSPRAVMNAAYSGVQTKIEESDNAGHCSNWSSWPKN